MAYHSANPETIKDVGEFETKTIDKTTLLPKLPGTSISTSFSPIFAGGYSAGYYSYKWAEVLDADAFEFFQNSGIFNQEVANKFREFILEKGGTEHPMELYKQFRGKEPDVSALLRRAGLH
jgi:peptidyl-dipeptidase Dcp